MANKIVQTIKNTYKDLKRNESMGDVTIVSIHVRLTDYKRHLKQRFDMEPIPAKWFSTAMNYFSNRYQVNLYKLEEHSNNYMLRKFLISKWYNIIKILEPHISCFE